jgi:hypothetical protein
MRSATTIEMGERRRSRYTELAGGALRRAWRLEPRERDGSEHPLDAPRLNLVQAYLRTIRGSRI